jgi:hypothetical protein
MTSVIHGYCTLCRSRCGTLNTVDGDQLISVEPVHRIRLAKPYA